MAAKIAIRNNSSSVQTLAEEKRWTVISVSSGKAVYLRGEQGLTEADAERISRSLAIETQVVPERALDRFGCLQPETLEEAVAVARAEEE